MASLRLGQLYLEDSMWRAVGCHSLVHNPLFLAMIIVEKEVDIHVDFVDYLQDLNSLTVLSILEIHITHS